MANILPGLNDGHKKVVTQEIYESVNIAQDDTNKTKELDTVNKTHEKIQKLQREIEMLRATSAVSKNTNDNGNEVERQSQSSI